MRKHKESDQQIRFVNWFRYHYPAFARLLEHPHNEGNAFNRHQQVIANKEGVTKGVADLLLHVPSLIGDLGNNSSLIMFTSLAIEMKTLKGTQSPEQKTWQRLFEAAGGKYIIGRDFDKLTAEVTTYMENVPACIFNAVTETHANIQAEGDREAVELLKKIVKGE